MHRLGKRIFIYIGKKFYVLVLKIVTVFDKVTLINSVDYLYMPNDIFSKSFGIKIFGSAIDIDHIYWNCDYISNYNYPKIRFDKIKFNKLFNKGIDVKFPWELSRFHFGIELAFRYNETKDTYYYDLFKRLVLDWISQNRFLYGINWACNMDVAIRAVNWILACDIFSDIFFADKNFRHKISKSIIQHINYIDRFIVFSPFNNHVVSEYSTLLILSLSLKGHYKFDHWKKKAIKGVEKCMSEQIFDDGTDKECSIPYHRLVLEIFSIATIIAHNNNNIRFSDRYYKKLFRMFEFVAAYTDSNGNAPQIGDNDSGRFIYINDQSEYDHRYLLFLGETIFNYKFFNSFDRNELFSIQSNVEKLNIDLLNISPRISEFPIVFSEGGYYIHENDCFHLLVFSPNSTTSGHSHHDSGSFTLSYKGTPIIVDPGSYSYTRDFEKRNIFRGYKSHNLYYSTNVDTVRNSVKKNEAKIVCIEHNFISISYKIDENSKVSRKFKLHEDSLVINDTISSVSTVNSVIHFMTNNIVELDSNEYLVDSIIIVKFLSDTDFKSAIESYDFSPSYNQIQQMSSIVFSANAKVKIIITESISDAGKV